jgi:hypothetical protein
MLTFLLAILTNVICSPLLKWLGCKIMQFLGGKKAKTQL